jgi:hypothetical protein
MAQTPQTPPQANSPAAGTRVTVIGCLKEAPTVPTDTTATATGTTGTPSAPGTPGTPANTTSAAESYVLTAATASPNEALPNSTEGATGSATAGAVGTSGVTAASTYRLVANPSALSPHVGKKLELTGTIEPASAGSPGAAASPNDALANAPKLHVQAGRVLSDKCEPQ